MRETGRSAGSLDHVTTRRRVSEPMRPISVRRVVTDGSSERGTTTGRCITDGSRTAPYYRGSHRRRRGDGEKGAAGRDHALAQLYTTVRLFVNFFQPSFKLAGKAREGARVRKRYHPPATPCERLLADPRTPEAVRGRVEALRATLDPVRLLSEMRAAQQALVALADQDPDRPAVVDACRSRRFWRGCGRPGGRGR